MATYSSTSAHFFRKALPVLIAALLFWAVLTFTERAMLFKTQDLSLFLLDSDFFRQSLLVPGGLLGWAGSFLTQLLYLPWLGALIWTWLLVLSAWLTVKVFDIPCRIAAIAAIPVVMLITANMHLGYSIFIMRMQDYFFAPTIGYLAMLGIMAAVWRSRRAWLQFVLLTVFAAGGYSVAGVFALAGVLAAGTGVMCASKFGGNAPRPWQRAAMPLWSVILCIAVPFMVYGLYTRYRMQDSWFMGLPSISEPSLTGAVRLPYWILFAVAIVFSAMRGMFQAWKDFKKGSVAVQIAAAAAAVAICIIFWYRDDNFKAELEMSLAIDKGDWQQVEDTFRRAQTRKQAKDKTILEERSRALAGTADETLYNELMDKYDGKMFEPTRLMVLMRDLALLKQDKALDQAFTMRDGGRAQKSPYQVPMAFQAGRQLYMNYGLVNMAYRWCLEDQVEHGWSVGTLKYMATYGILMDETEFAAKYLDKLDRTLFHRGWSHSQRQLMANRQSVLDAAPYSEIVPYMSFGDRMSNDRVKVESYLMRHFAQDRDSLATPQFDRAALLWAMRSQDINLFWKALAQYLGTASELALPKSVQEAVILYSSLEKDNMGIPIDKSVRDSYLAFQKYTTQGAYRSEREAALPFRLKFGGTFYYYYYFVRGLKTF